MTNNVNSFSIDDTSYQQDSEKPLKIIIKKNNDVGYHNFNQSPHINPNNMNNSILQQQQQQQQQATATTNYNNFTFNNPQQQNSSNNILINNNNNFVNNNNNPSFINKGFSLSNLSFPRFDKQQKSGNIKKFAEANSTQFESWSPQLNPLKQEIKLIREDVQSFRTNLQTQIENLTRYKLKQFEEVKRKKEPRPNFYTKEKKKIEEESDEDVDEDDYQKNSKLTGKKEAKYKKKEEI